MSEFKVGDRVRIRKDLVEGEYGENWFNSQMVHLLGRTVTLSEDTQRHGWNVSESIYAVTEKMFDLNEEASTPLDMNELTDLVTQWSIDKGIDKADPIKQYLKVSEEAGEIAAALSRNNRDDLLDALGDSFVTLIVLCKQLDTTPTECLNMAYNVIKDRTGKVVDGVFIKKEDLK